ncbi:MAG: hypothetical protein K1X67_25470 [Fimbriimonadaceae bacterium]|nr:hypothetical protein [Fimbriimonadaceae bacterium]
MKRTLILAATLGLILTGQSQLLQTKDPSTLKKISPQRFARIDASGQIIGPWIPLTQPGAPGIQGAVAWVNGWDSTDTDVTLLPDAIYNQVYGNTAYGGAPGYFGDTYNWPIAVNDITVNPATARKSAGYVHLTNTWNPGGTAFPSGSSNMALAVFTGHGFNPTTDSLSGLVFDFGTQVGGYYWLQANLSGTGYGIALPDGAGHSWIVMGRISGGSLVQLATGNCSPDIRNMCSPGEPQFPGTNPSSSSQNCWMDINPANFIVASNELYSLNYTGSSVGIFQPTLGLFVDANQPTISGTCTLQDIDPFTSRPVQWVEITTTQAGNPGNVISVQTVALGSAGQYEVIAPTSNGNYDLYARSFHWLRRIRAGVSYLGSNVTGINFSLENGDCDEDNEIGIGDFAILSAAYNSDPSSGNWNVSADLNHDDAVDIADYAILSFNYGLGGD